MLKKVLTYAKLGQMEICPAEKIVMHPGKGYVAEQIPGMWALPGRRVVSTAALAEIASRNSWRLVLP